MGRAATRLGIPSTHLRQPRRTHEIHLALPTGIPLPLPSHSSRPRQMRRQRASRSYVLSLAFISRPPRDWLACSDSLSLLVVLDVVVVVIVLEVDGIVLSGNGGSTQLGGPLRTLRFGPLGGALTGRASRHGGGETPWAGHAGTCEPAGPRADGVASLPGQTAYILLARVRERAI